MHQANDFGAQQTRAIIKTNTKINKHKFNTNTNVDPTDESMALGSVDTHHTALPSDIRDVGQNLADQHSLVALNLEFQAADTNAALTATNVLYDKNRALGSVEPHNNDQQTGMITLPESIECDPGLADFERNIDFSKS
jgi:hypothetical protein